MSSHLQVIKRQGWMMQEQEKVINHLKGRLTKQSTSLSYVSLTLDNYIFLLLQVIKRQGRMMQKQEKVIIYQQMYSTPA